MPDDRQRVRAELLLLSHYLWLIFIPHRAQQHPGPRQDARWSSSRKVYEPAVTGLRASAQRGDACEEQLRGAQTVC